MAKEAEKPSGDNETPQPLADASPEDKILTQKELVEQLRGQWKLLWSERFNDKLLAEDVSINEYINLRVEQGTIIHATRDFKPLNFKEILEQNMVENADRFVPPNAEEGGWNKFVKTKITSSPAKRRKRANPSAPKKQGSQQPKKGGRGWLHAP